MEKNNNESNVIYIVTIENNNITKNNIKIFKSYFEGYNYFAILVINMQNKISDLIELDNKYVKRYIRTDLKLNNHNYAHFLMKNKHNIIKYTFKKSYLI